MDSKFENPDPPIIQSTHLRGLFPFIYRNTYKSIHSMNLLLIVHSLKSFIRPGHFICIIHQAKPSIYPFIPPFIFPLFIYSIHLSSIPSTLSFYQPINQPIFFYISHPCIHPYCSYNSPFIYTSIPNTHQSHLAIHPIHSSILPSPTGTFLYPIHLSNDPSTIHPSPLSHSSIAYLHATS